MIAKLIAARSNLSMNRQIFFCSVGGYDTHGDQLAGQAGLLTELSQALNAFYSATVELGVAEFRDDIHRFRFRPHLSDERLRFRSRLGQSSICHGRRGERRTFVRNFPDARGQWSR